MSTVRLMILGATCLLFVSTSSLQAGEKKSPGDASRLEADRVTISATPVEAITPADALSKADAK